MVAELLTRCLYFTANRLARMVEKMADDEFKTAGLSPAHAFVLMLVNESPGRLQMEIAQSLAIASSTLTRFADQLEKGGWVRRVQQGKHSRLYPTPKGKAQHPVLRASWQRLYHRYSKVLGYAEGDRLTRMVGKAGADLEAPWICKSKPIRDEGDNANEHCGCARKPAKTGKHGNFAAPGAGRRRFRRGAN